MINIYAKYVGRVFAEEPLGYRYESKQALLEAPELKTFECPWCGNDIPILWDDLLDSEKQDSIITCNLCELFEKTIHEVLWAKHGWDDL